MSKARRAALLLHTNPRLFIRRLAMYAGSPRTAVVAVGEDQERTVRARASYDRWMAGTRPSATSLTASDALLSVIMPVCDTPAQFLDDAIASVVAQTYAKWELCIADDASSLPHIREVLDRWASLDKRIRVQYRDVRGHISRASNAALDMARGDFVVLLDHDDVLLPQALMRVAEAASEPSVDFIYSDEDKLAPDGARIDPFFKPAWSPSLLLSCNYITHLAAIRRSIVVDVCGFRPGYEGSQDHDLFLRATSQSRRIAHIPDVLYSWRQSNASTALVNSAKPYAVAAARRSLEEALQRGSGLAGLEESHLNGLFLARRAVPAPASVQIMSSGDSETIQDIARVPGVLVAEQAEYLLWVQETAQARHGWFWPLLEALQDEGVGVAGGVMVDPGGRVLQSGVSLDGSGQPRFAYRGLSNLPTSAFYLNLKDLPREVSAVHHSVAAMRREVWEELGGVRTNLPPDLSFYDLCLRAREAGYRNVVAPLAKVKVNGVAAPTRISETWPWQPYLDPYSNPNFSDTGDLLPLRGRAEPAIRMLDGPMAHPSPATRRLR